MLAVANHSNIWTDGGVGNLFGQKILRQRLQFLNRRLAHTPMKERDY